MSKSGKGFLIVVVIVLLVLGIVWAVYENYKPQPASINANTNLPNENKGIDNIINDFVENEITNTLEEANVIDNNSSKSEENINNSSNNESKEDESNSNTSEVVEGTNESREEKAVELAKEYYEEEYGSTEGVYFRYDSVYKDGRHIVIASSNGATLAFLYVDLNTGLVEAR